VVRVTLKPGLWADPLKMLQAIRDAGFTPVPEDVRMTLTGTLESQADRWVLVLDRMKTPMEVLCLTPRQDSPTARALKENAGRVIEIRGRWVAEGQGALEAETIRDGAGDR